jgi:hypothetical protein
VAGTRPSGQRPRTAYYRHPLEQGIWSFVTQNLYLPLPAGHRETIRQGYDFQRPLTRAFHDRGGKLLAGSDTIEVGKQTDLLLLDGDPLADVAAASKIAGVLVRGRWIGGEEIAGRMRALAASGGPQ